jgi:uncharacterized protein (TIGR03083 family)
VNMSSPTPSNPTYLQQRLQQHLQSFSELIAAAGSDPTGQQVLEREVPGCPGWTAEALIIHLGTVLHRVCEGITTGVAPQTAPPAAPSGDPTELQKWFDTQAQRALNVLDSVDPEATVWQPFPAPPRPAVWRRRLTHESMVHLWDLSAVHGKEPVVDPMLVSDGIDEFFEVVLPRIAGAADFVAPEGSLHVHCTDVHGEWWLQFESDGALTFHREHAKGDAAVRGPAASILQRLWHRPLPNEWVAPEVIGSTAVAEAWMALPTP